MTKTANEWDDQIEWPKEVKKELQEIRDILKNIDWLRYFEGTHTGREYCFYILDKIKDHEGLAKKLHNAGFDYSEHNDPNGEIPNQIKSIPFVQAFVQSQMGWLVHPNQHILRSRFKQVSIWKKVREGEE